MSNELFTLWRTHDKDVWKESPAHYLTLARRLLGGGEPLLAFDVMQEAATLWPADPAVLTVQALALARSGAAAQANTLLRSAYDQGRRDEDTVALLARTYKDLGLAEPDSARRTRHLTQSAALYRESFDADRDVRYWSGINAATLYLLLGDTATARQYAAAARDSCLRDSPLPPDADSYWRYATLGEAELVAGDDEAAGRWYAQAVAQGPGRRGDIASTRRNARLLLQTRMDSAASARFLARCLPTPGIAIFSGHMLDLPDAVVPRFPAAAEGLVKDRIRAYVAAHGIGIGFGSAACGADMLFLEAVLEAGGDINIVLPSTPERFVGTSVDRIAGGGWVRRFEELLGSAKQVIQVSNESVSDVFYTYVNVLLCGLGRLDARFVDGDLHALAVWDGQPGKSGGTAAAVQLWQACGETVHSIHPATGAEHRLQAMVGAANSTGAWLKSADSERGEDRRQVMSMLFADAVGFSKLDEHQIPKFVAHFLEPIGALLDRSAHAPVVRNTWGDALYFVFEDVRAAGLMALDICDLVNRTDWQAVGLPESFGIRMGLHSGPVYPVTDPVIKQFNYTGVHVSRAARIEPVTPPGMAYASREFAALAAACGVREFTCDYVGRTPMAKHYGEFPTYRVRRL